MNQTEIKKLLAVLDLPEDELFNWIAGRFIKLPDDFNTFCSGKEAYLADLAFRLRDEVCGEVVHMFDRFNFEMAFRQVYVKVGISEGGEFLIWLLCESKPIHWIIACLLSKEL